MKLNVLSFLLVIVFSSVVSAQVVPFDGAPTLTSFDAASTQQVDLLLRSIHELPSKAQFESVAGGRDIVVAFALASDSLQRDRALIALAKYWPSSDVFLLLAKVIADPTARKATRLRAMISLGETFRQRALPILEHYLSSPDPSVQTTAIRAIGLGSTKEGFDRLAALRQETESQSVIDAIDRFGMLVSR